MAEVIRMPRMSDTMTEGVLVSWVKKVGDKVKSGDILAEVETDKATMELESYSDGTLLHIGVSEGSSVPVNAVIAVIGKEGEDFKALLEQEGGAPTPAANKETVKKEVPAATPEATPEPTAEPTPEPEKKQPQPEAQPETHQSDSRILASPLAKMLAKEKGVDLANVKGSGEQGRIVKKDIETLSKEKPEKSKPGVTYGEEGFEDVAISQMRKTIARRLVESKFTAPHFYLTIEIDMGRIIKARKSINEFLGQKVSFNDIIIKAAASALRKHPKVNASWMGEKIRYYKHINIGVAIAVDDGLVVPVIRHSDQKGISTISEEIKSYAEKANNKKLQPDDFSGNTFTVSNLGMFGIEEFTAIINPPDACILAVGAIIEKPVVKNGELAIGNIMKVTLSCDHRVVDGATGAEFLQTLKQFLEEPVTILA